MNLLNSQILTRKSSCY